MRLLFAAAMFSIVACSSQPKERAPAQHQGHQPSPEFIAAEEVPRQHSLILLDPKGHFGYHVSEFNSNHQHQYIVRGKVTPERKVAGKASNGYFSVTSDMPRFLLRELISGQRKNFPANIYDGLIITRPQKIVETEARYEIETKLYESPMHAKEERPANLAYIVFGSYGQPTKTHYLAHLIKGANNYEQLLVAEFDQPQLIDNGKILVLGQADTKPLAAGEKVQGQIDGATVSLKITRQVYFDKRTAEGFGDY